MSLVPCGEPWFNTPSPLFTPSTVTSCMLGSHAECCVHCQHSNNVLCGQDESEHHHAEHLSRHPSSTCWGEQRNKKITHTPFLVGVGLLGHQAHVVVLHISKCLLQQVQHLLVPEQGQRGGERRKIDRQREIRKTHTQSQ